MPSPHQLPIPSADPIEVHERVRVVVDFSPRSSYGGAGRGPKVRPLAFLWRNRKIVVKKTNLVFKRQHGDRWNWCFAVSDEGNNYVLRYEPEEMCWTLEEVYEGT